VIIDAHHHLWLAPERLPWLSEDGHEPLRRPFGTDAFRAAVNGLGVSGSVLVEAGSQRAEETTELLAIAADEPSVLGVVGWLDPNEHDANGSVERALAAPNSRWLKGLRIQVQSQPADYLDAAHVDAVVDSMHGRGLVLELVLRPEHLPSVARLTARHPELTVVIDHCAKPSIADGADAEKWHEDIAAVAASASTVCKLSGLVTEAEWSSWSVDDLLPYSDAVIDAFGANRVMFGSDWPVCLLAASYQEVLGAARQMLSWLTPSERTAVLGRTACRVYGLENAG
jgi:L-fuconolactonase